LLKVFNLDKLNYNNDPQTGGDGFFDSAKFNDGCAIRSNYFHYQRTFGELLFSKLSNTGSGENYNNTSSYNENQKNMCFVACTATPNLEHYKTVIKNILLRGRYIIWWRRHTNWFNVPPGSVVVTAAGRILVEGID
jgi:cell surface protein SprA